MTKKVVTRTLAIRVTEAHHTSSYLQELVMNVLTGFCINKEQILGIVTDNATNMLSTVKKLNQDVQAFNFDENEDSEEINDNFNLDGFVDDALDISPIHNMPDILKRRVGKGAILDQATRWDSIYLMIERIIELKPFVTDIPYPAVTLSDTQREEVKKLECLLHEPYIATKILQTANLTASILYKEWCNLIFRFLNLIVK